MGVYSMRRVVGFLKPVGVLLLFKLGPYEI